MFLFCCPQQQHSQYFLITLHKNTCESRLWNCFRKNDGVMSSKHGELLKVRQSILRGIKVNVSFIVINFSV